MFKLWEYRTKCEAKFANYTFLCKQDVISPKIGSFYVKLWFSRGTQKFWESKNKSAAP